jgi:pyruvate kinase
MPFSMALTVSCYLARRPRERIPSNLVGFYPSTSVLKFNRLVAVLMMAETCILAEYAICYPQIYDDLRATQVRPTGTAETVAIAAVAAAYEQNASAILVLSTSGNTARLISKYRPNVPIITGAFS